MVAKCDHLRNLKFSNTLPYAFTEHGAIMAATILNSSQAVEVSIFVVRAFIQMRNILLSNKILASKLKILENKLQSHDEILRDLVTAIRRLMENPASIKKREIGFTAKIE